MGNSSTKKERIFWANLLGPYFLCGAYSVLLLYVVPFTGAWLVTLALGSACVLKWRKKGFYLALGLMAACASWKFPLIYGPIWSSLLLISIGLSWWMTLMGREEIQVSDAANQALKEELDTLQEHFSSVSREKGEWIAKYERLSLDQSSYQRKEKSLQQALEAAQNELIGLKQQALPQVKEPTPEPVLEKTETIIAQENPLELKAPEDMRQMQFKYDLLREQFEEKTVALREARQQLFALETELFALEKARAEEQCVSTVEDQTFTAHLEACEEAIEEEAFQVEVLESLVTDLMGGAKESKPRKPRAKKSAPENLPLILQEAIDNSTNQTIQRN